MTTLIPEPGLPVFVLMGFLAFAVEKWYTSRLTIVANAVLITSLLGWTVFSSEGWFGLWTTGIIIAGIVSSLSYLSGFPLESLNEIFYALYSSKTVLGVLLAGRFDLINQEISTLIFTISLWVVSVKILGHRFPFVSNS